MADDMACGFCGYPDWRHRVTDAIQEQVDAGYPLYEVLEDYGMWDEAEYQKVKAAVELAGEQ